MSDGDVASSAFRPTERLWFANRGSRSADTLMEAVRAGLRDAGQDPSVGTIRHHAHRDFRLLLVEALETRELLTAGLPARPLTAFPCFEILPREPMGSREPTCEPMGSCEPMRANASQWVQASAANGASQWGQTSSKFIRPARVTVCAQVVPIPCERVDPSTAMTQNVV